MSLFHFRQPVDCATTSRRNVREASAVLKSYQPSPPFNFGGLFPEFSDFARSPIVVWPVPFERTTTYMAGTRKGPCAILEASRNMELYDEELGGEVYRMGIHTLEEMETQEGTIEQVMAAIRTTAASLLGEGKFFVMLGGEHSITSPAVSACARKYEDLTVLQIDAHADLRESYQGNPYSHASAMRRVLEICPAVQVGIRSLSVEEAEDIPKLKTKIYWAKEIVERPTAVWAPRVAADLSEHVYLTIDIDGLDPSLVPATGTHEPGGFTWQQVTALIREVAARKKIVAMDLVELLPQPGHHASDFLAAKLIYKTLGYIFLHK